MAEQKSFMNPDELRHIRKVILGISQAKLADQLANPDNGTAITKFTLCRWESGKTRVPLWAAKRILEFERVAKIYDEEVKDSGIRPD